MLKTPSEEELVARIFLEPFFSQSLSTEISQQLSAILQKQFDPQNHNEIGGSVFYKDKNLTFRIVKAALTEGLEQMLDQFQAGNLEYVETLATYARIFFGNMEVYLPKIALERYSLHVLAETLEDELTKPSLVKEKVIRESLVYLYKDFILGHSYIATDKELGKDEPGFVGLFHVHEDGSPPSEFDIDTNKSSEFPIFTISAKQDYLQSGIEIYLIYSGQSKKLYQGLLPPTQKQ